MNLCFLKNVKQAPDVYSHGLVFLYSLTKWLAVSLIIHFSTVSDNPNGYEIPRDARIGIDRYLRFYNTERPHSSIQYHTPESVYFNG